MKHVLFFIAALMTTMDVSANDTPLGYWNNSGFVELNPDESFIYKYVLAMDDESQKVLMDLYETMSETGDKSILRKNDNRWYVRNDYPLPEINIYESPFYNNSSEAHHNELYVFLPEFDLYMNSHGQIDNLLEFLGDKVTIKSENGPNLSGGTTYKLTCNMHTSEEVLETAMSVNKLGFEGLTYFSPKKFSIDRDYNSYLISVLTGNINNTGENGFNLIYEMNWEGVNYRVFDFDSGECPWETTDEGLAISNSIQREHMWDVQTDVGYGFTLEQGHNYIIRLTMMVPSDGTYHVDLCSWTANQNEECPYCINEIPLKASNEFEVINIECPNYFADGIEGEKYQNCMVLLGSGGVVGTTVVKKVEIYEKVGATGRNGESAINATKVEKTADSIYNLAGQKVDAGYKGIVIKNGKKLVIH